MLSVLAVRKMPSACFLPKKIPILEAGHCLPLHFPTLELVSPLYAVKMNDNSPIFFSSRIYGTVKYTHIYGGTFSWGGDSG